MDSTFFAHKLSARVSNPYTSTQVGSTKNVNFLFKLGISNFLLLEVYKEAKAFQEVSFNFIVGKYQE